MSDPHFALATARLALRPFVPEDYDWLVRLHADERAMREIGGVMTPEATRTFLRQRVLDYYAQHPGLGIWVTFERDGGAVVGCHLLNNIRGDTLIQVGYYLWPQFWGRGYATEMCVGVLRYGFAGLGLPRIHAITNLPHTASQKVLAKAGLQRAGERSFPAYSDGAPLAFFQRDRAAWLAEFGA